MRRSLKQDNGITLVALVITIIVMLILVAVAVYAAFSENGLIGRAKEAEDRWRQEQDNEMALGNVAEDILNNIGMGGKTEPKTDGDGFAEENYTKEDGDLKITVPEDFAIIDPDTGNSILGNEWENYLTEENIDRGIVIKDRVGNEFVWVPVPEPNKMYFMNDAQQVGKLYAVAENPLGEITFNQNLTGQTYNADSGLREPANLTDTWVGDVYTNNIATIKNILTVFGKAYGGTDALVLTEWLKLQQEDFDNMIASVKYYKGFYVGRYETSGFTSTVASKKNQGTTGTNPDNDINPSWYKAYQKQKELYTSGSVRSTMIWGCAWDQVMLWMKDVKNTGDSSKYYILDSTGMGNYNVAGRIKTGTNDSYRVKNIYDLAGNLHEYTMEAINTYDRVSRRRFLPP